MVFTLVSIINPDLVIFVRIPCAVSLCVEFKCVKATLLYSIFTHGDLDEPTMFQPHVQHVFVGNICVFVILLLHPYTL